MLICGEWQRPNELRFRHATLQFQLGECVNAYFLSTVWRTNIFYNLLLSLLYAAPMEKHIIYLKFLPKSKQLITTTDCFSYGRWPSFPFYLRL